MDEWLIKAAQPLIAMALAEDLGERGDITTQAIAIAPTSCSAEIVAKADGIVAGIGIAEAVFAKLSVSIHFDRYVEDGHPVKKWETLLSLSGPTDAVLSAERTALNFLGRLCGIATLTRRIVDAVHGTKARILDTRKTTPGWRVLEKYAVRCGGGYNHRQGLWDMVLIKDNHIVAAGGITPAVKRCQQYLQRHQIQALIEVEAKSIEQVLEAASLGVDRIMLDNMTPELMREAVALVAGRIPLEASGNVSLENVRLIAETGVDFISIGALTHSARALDISLEFL